MSLNTSICILHNFTDNFTAQLYRCADDIILMSFDASDHLSETLCCFTWLNICECFLFLFNPAELDSLKVVVNTKQLPWDSSVQFTFHCNYRYLFSLGRVVVTQSITCSVKEFSYASCLAPVTE